jgi:hypothetical protein
MRNWHGNLSPFGSWHTGRRKDDLSQVLALLFSANEPGVFYDFDDWSTLFQDTAGTQPVTAANQGVALALDKSKGLKLGPELVTNGTFDENIDGWTNSTPSAGNISFSAGQLLVERVSGGTSAYQALACVVGYTYQVLFNFTSVVSGLPRISATSSASTPGSGVTDPQATRFVFVATATTMYIHLGLNSGNGTSGSYDNISVRELPGNHATQATTAARPLTVIHPDGGVRNLLDRSEEFDNAVWAKQGFGAGTAPVVTSNAALAPDGTMTAERVVFTLPSGATVSDISQLIQLFTFGDANYAGSFYIKSNTGADQNIVLLIRNIQVATVTATTEWQRVSALSLASAVASNFGLRARGTFTAGTVDLLVWGAQLEEGSTATPYQKRVNFLDVTEAGKRSIRRLYFNGTSHFMTTPVITPNTDKAQVFAGVRKLSDAAVGSVVELSENSRVFNGTFDLRAPTGPAANFSSIARGSSGPSTEQEAIASPFVAPVSAVLSSINDIAANTTVLRVNGAVGATAVGDKGTGNFLAYPMFIGARNGTSLFLNGYIDQLITRFGTNLATGAIETTEKYVSTKSPEVTL